MTHTSNILNHTHVIIGVLSSRKKKHVAMFLLTNGHAPVSISRGLHPSDRGIEMGGCSEENRLLGYHKRDQRDGN